MLSPAQRFFWFGPEKPSLVSFISPSVPRSLLRRRRHGRPLLVPRSPPTSRRLRLRRGPPLLQAIRALSPPPPTPSGAFSSPLPSFDSPSPPCSVSLHVWHNRLPCDMNNSLFFFFVLHVLCELWTALFAYKV
jgi:hypothetical protein